MRWRRPVLFGVILNYFFVYKRIIKNELHFRNRLIINFTYSDVTGCAQFGAWRTPGLFGRATARLNGKEIRSSFDENG